MALIVKRKGGTITTIDNPIEESYVRISFICDQNGKDIQVSVAYYDDRNSYQLGECIQNCDIPIQNSSISFPSFPSLYDIHEKIYTQYIQMGYDCEIVDIQ